MDTGWTQEKVWPFSAIAESYFWVLVLVLVLVLELPLPLPLMVARIPAALLWRGRVLMAAMRPPKARQQHHGEQRLTDSEAGTALGVVVECM
jgi:hypothetical protein